MRREELLQEIARLDDEINRQLAGAKLPTLVKKPFPFGSWIVAIVFFALWQYGGRIPEVGMQIAEYSQWIFYAALAMGALALLSTFAYLVRLVNREDNEKYRQATAEVRELQTQRQELVMRLKELESN